MLDKGQAKSTYTQAKPTYNRDTYQPCTIRVTNAHVCPNFLLTTTTSTTCFTMESPCACGPPPPEAIYTDLETAATAIQAHAKQNGYALFKRNSRPKRVVYVCDRFRKGQATKSSTYTSKRRLRSGSKKCGCNMRVDLKLDSISGNWHLSVLEGTHNHEASADSVAHPVHRIAALDSEVITQIQSLSASGIATIQILSAIRYQFPSAILVRKDISNIIQKALLEQLGRKTQYNGFLKYTLYYPFLDSTNVLLRASKQRILSYIFYES